jgi:hypothetical protein
MLSRPAALFKFRVTVIAFNKTHEEHYRFVTINSFMLLLILGFNDG